MGAAAAVKGGAAKHTGSSSSINNYRHVPDDVNKCLEHHKHEAESRVGHNYPDNVHHEYIRDDVCVASSTSIQDAARQTDYNMGSKR